MRHRVVTKKLNRDMDHRKELIKNLAIQLIENEKIHTTEVKAKFIRPHVEKLISKAKKVNGNVEVDFKFKIVKDLRRDIHSDSAIRKLLEDLALRFKDRPGGYTRITKTGNRDGDNAPMARIELVKDKTNE